MHILIYASVVLFCFVAAQIIPTVTLMRQALIEGILHCILSSGSVYLFIKPPQCQWTYKYNYCTCTLYTPLFLRMCISSKMVKYIYLTVIWTFTGASYNVFKFSIFIWIVHFYQNIFKFSILINFDVRDGSKLRVLVCWWWSDICSSYRHSFALLWKNW